MSDLRKYWQRHPIQLRALAAAMLVMLPVWLPILALWTFRREIAEEFKIHYRECWSLATTGEGT
jgi:hypothetical protein